MGYLRSKQLSPDFQKLGPSKGPRLPNDDTYTLPGKIPTSAKLAFDADRRDSTDTLTNGETKQPRGLDKLVDWP